MSDAQGGGVGVHAVGDHPVVDGATGGDLVAGQQTHDARVPVVELDQRDRKTWADTEELPARGGGGSVGGERGGGLTGSMALKRWVMKDAPCWTASSAWDRLAME